jgi:hypothetical protein
MTFALPGVFIGMVIYGLMVGVLERYMRRNRGRIATPVVYAYSLVPVAGILRGDSTTFAGFYLAGLLPLLLGLLLIERKRERPQTYLVTDPPARVPNPN